MTNSWKSYFAKINQEHFKNEVLFLRNYLKTLIKICGPGYGEQELSKLNYEQEKGNKFRRTTNMNVRQRVLEARIAERISKNPSLAKDLGIEIRYKKTADSCNQNNVKRSTDNV